MQNILKCTRILGTAVNVLKLFFLFKCVRSTSLGVSISYHIFKLFNHENNVRKPL